MKQFTLLFIIVALATCPFLCSTGTNSSPSTQTVEEVIFHTIGESGDINRGPSTIPFSCYAYGALNMLVFNSSTINAEATVTVEYTSTGYLERTIILISTCPAEVYLSSPGEFSIDVELPCGKHYIAFLSL